MTRREEIEAAANNVMSMGFVQAFIEGAEWADQNPQLDAGWVVANSCEKKLVLTEEMLAIAVETLNKIAIAQMGELDYTQDFFELVKTEVRGALHEINKLEKYGEK